MRPETGNPGHSRTLGRPRCQQHPHCNPGRAADHPAFSEALTRNGLLSASDARQRQRASR